MPQRKTKKSPRGAIIKKIRKPIAPPSKTIEDPTKYKRERELEKIRRDEKSGNL
ncbi:MAG: hypothetical protein Q7S58_15345 [Candidatus Binatus sp.]|uniref:hypothetical protein n=1 Tax=Candidatus Binatus sp. TaxID=2811406 RepID=UPI002723C782|nr:hypothetical protein [Candidatus Binatus sp.]MDO8433776.1 hypothetical protein [Candidatus Binatus sp.]